MTIGPAPTHLDDPLGAFCRHTHVALCGASSGLLQGLTFGVKDVFHIAGHPTGFGHPDWLRTHPPATVTATAVQRLLAAGAHMVGKTHTDELAYSLTGENVHYGTPVNPRDPQRIPGGSSNGSAAAVAGGLVDFALGTDCGGSVRLPASYCGILGMRPTHGRVPLDGVIPFGPSFDVCGWFARDPDVFVRVGRVLLADHAPATLPQRLLVATDAFAMVDQRVRETLYAALARVSAVVGATREVTVSIEGLQTWLEVFRVIQACEIWMNHGPWIQEVQPTFGPGIRERFAWAATVTPEQAAVARQKRVQIMARLQGLIAADTVLCLPTSPRIAPFKNTVADLIEVIYRQQAMCLLCIAGLGGLPQVSLPLAMLDGLPLGLSLVGPRGADTALLELARVLGPIDHR
jgi:amidase